MTDLNKTSGRSLFEDIRLLIEQSRANIAISVNAEITMVYWKIGQRIKTEVLNNKRAGYGEEIIINLSTNLTSHYGKGWSDKQIRHCLRFAEIFPDEKIVYAVRRQLSWTHLRNIIYIEDELKRMFYIEMCKIEKWSTRILQERINSMLYERTAISKKPEETIRKELELRANASKLTRGW